MDKQEISKHQTTSTPNGKKTSNQSQLRDFHKHISKPHYSDSQHILEQKLLELQLVCTVLEFVKMK